MDLWDIVELRYLCNIMTDLWDSVVRGHLCIVLFRLFSLLQNEIGRGINVAIVDPLTKTVINATHFDTYEKSKYIVCEVLVHCWNFINQWKCGLEIGQYWAI